MGRGREGLRETGRGLGEGPEAGRGRGAWKGPGTLRGALTQAGAPLASEGGHGHSGREGAAGADGARGGPGPRGCASEQAGHLSCPQAAVPRFPPSPGNLVEAARRVCLSEERGRGARAGRAPCGSVPRALQRIKAQNQPPGGAAGTPPPQTRKRDSLRARRGRGWTWEWGGEALPGPRGAGLWGGDRVGEALSRGGPQVAQVWRPGLWPQGPGV